MRSFDAPEEAGSSDLHPALPGDLAGIPEVTRAITSFPKTVLTTVAQWQNPGGGLGLSRLCVPQSGRSDQHWRESTVLVIMTDVGLPGTPVLAPGTLLGMLTVAGSRVTVKKRLEDAGVWGTWLL